MDRVIAALNAADTVLMTPATFDSAKTWRGLNSTLHKQAMAAASTWTCGSISPTVPMNKLAVSGTVS